MEITQDLKSKESFISFYIILIVQFQNQMFYVQKGKIIKTEQIPLDVTSIAIYQPINSLEL